MTSTYLIKLLRVVVFFVIVEAFKLNPNAKILEKGLKWRWDGSQSEAFVVEDA